MPNRSVQITRLAGASTIVFLLLAGCGNDQDESSASSTEQQTEEPSPELTTPNDDSGSDDSTTDDDTTDSSPDSSDEPSGDSTDEPIPDDAVDYADALIVAWGSGDQGRIAQLANDEAIETLNQYGEEGGPHWDQTEHDAGAGSAFVTYENTEDGTTLELRVENEAASHGEEHAVVEAKIS